MKWLVQTVLLGFLALAASVACTGQSEPSRYDPASELRSSGKANGFLEFTLSRINPQDKDYGRCLSDTRVTLFDQTAKNAYFWSNLAALGLLTTLFMVIIYQRRVLVAREWATGEILTQFENALARSHEHIRAATQKNRQLSEALGLARESVAPLILQSVQPKESSVASSPKARTTAIRASASIPQSLISDQASNTQTPAHSTEAANQMKLFVPEVDLIMKVNSLEQQLAHSQRDNNALRRRMADNLKQREREQPRITTQTGSSGS